MKRKRHTPEQAVRKLREGEKRLNAGEELGSVLRQLDTAPEPPCFGRRRGRLLGRLL